jgi:hypothetical protein
LWPVSTLPDWSSVTVAATEKKIVLQYRWGNSVGYLEASIPLRLDFTVAKWFWSGDSDSKQHATIHQGQRQSLQDVDKRFSFLGMWKSKSVFFLWKTPGMESERERDRERQREWERERERETERERDREREEGVRFEIWTLAETSQEFINLWLINLVTENTRMFCGGKEP